MTKVLEEGNTLTVQNHRLVVRDSQGRIYQERRRLIPKDSQAEPDLERIEISDPAAHEKYFCRPAVHLCTLTDYVGPQVASAQHLGVEEDSYGTLTREDLGKTISVVKEIWYSPLLGINVSVKRIDPRHGTQIINVTEIVQGDPDPKLFSVPSGYTIVDKREKADHARVVSAPRINKE